MVSQIKKRILAGGQIEFSEALKLVRIENKELLYEAAEEITHFFHTEKFDTCSIINARSGRCPEDCKWCAQSVHYQTNIKVYDLVSPEVSLEHALWNQKKGVKRFSLVTSGRRVTGNSMSEICKIYNLLSKKTDMFLCASLGLLSKENLSALKASGVSRYHCNLETAPSYFGKLCSTHTQEEKIKTIKDAQEVGLEICSGGIIGMGESMEQRIELAFKLKELNVCSIPINILQPISGTPLENICGLSDDEILTTIAIFRFIHPKSYLRFAGGRAQISESIQLRALKIGINATIVGDMLTTVSSKIDEDYKLIKKAGYEL